MDLNAAIHTAEHGGFVRDDMAMAPGWSVRYVAEEKLLYLFRPTGERYRKLLISNDMRASFQWRTTLDGN